MLKTFENAKTEILGATKEVGADKVKTIALSSLNFISSNIKIGVSDLENLTEYLDIAVDQTT